MCVRIRMNFGNGGEDYTQRAWEMDRVGIWYGSWDPQDLYVAYGEERPIDAVSVATSLNQTMTARGTACRIGESGVHTAKRFDDLLAGAWIFVYFNRTLHFGQIADETLHCDPKVFSVGEEVFKYKTVVGKKSFALAELPEPFMLLAPAGRGNVYHVTSCEGLVKMLRDADSSNEVRTIFGQMPWDEWLAALGPKGWESLCTGYLISAHGYLPNGLAIGGTLADFDIVGSLSDGKGVFAQCKNDRRQRKINAEDEEAFLGLDAAHCFYFAYGGVNREIPGVVHIDGKQMFDWLENDPRGMAYKRRLRSRS